MLNLILVWMGGKRGLWEKKTSPTPPHPHTPILIRSLSFGLLLLAAPVSAYAQDSLDVTFRFLREGLVGIERAFLPGSFNGWGQPYQGNNACILAGDASEMTYVRLDNYWRHTVRLEIGQQYEYKIQTHLNQAGTDCAWQSDPLNPDVNPQDNNNSVVVITDPMVFQPAQELSAAGLMRAVSAGLFSTAAFTDVTFVVNGVERTDGLDFYDAATGVFRFELDREVRPGAQFRITATDDAGRTVEAEIGALLAPIEWASDPFTTVGAQAALRAFLTRLDGTVDPALTEATLLLDGAPVETVPVEDGFVETTVDLVLGENTFALRADIEGQVFTSDPLVLTRRLHPLDRVFADVTVFGSSNNFVIDLEPTDLAPEGFTTTWEFDEANSTSGYTGLTTDDREARGTATGPGELYFDVTLTRSDNETDFRRVAIVVDATGSLHEMQYEETPAWVENAVVYEVFPLTFGPEATGTAANPGTRFKEITRELDYIAQMGFNVIWFMPIMHNQFMDPLSGGYNIIDFYHVDPKLGTDDDFKALVERAHTLGIKVILDITPSHVSPQHPWVNSLRAGGPYAPYIQTTPSNHDRGLDGRGANLPEIWQVENGVNLYRKYDGFGDLANLDWDNDDLQAEMLDVFAYWVREFDIDGWRIDVYWGPWQRYGPDRFGRPVRTLMKRLKPDAWILGEIVGTGANTEVYYADDDFGNRVVGGIDAGYDWPFYFDAVRGTYGNLANYDAKAHNGDFWPGPHARYFRFLENHDEPRIAKLQAADPDRILPLTGFLLTTTGIPMIYHGQEVGFGNIPGDERRLPVTWNTERNGDFARYYQRLIHARRQFAAFGTQRLRTIHTTNSVYAYVRPRLDENAVVLVNFSNAARTVTIDPSPHVAMTTDGPVPYYDLFADTSGAYLDAFTVTVPPYETVVYVTEEAPGFVLPALPALPYGAVYTEVEDETAPGPEAFRLDQNYPNPFKPETTIRYAVAQPGPVRLEVFDVLGRRVVVLVDGLQPAGLHTVVFDAGTLPSGLYLYRLHAAGRTASRTMLLVK